MSVIPVAHLEMEINYFHHDYVIEMEEALIDIKYDSLNSGFNHSWFLLYQRKLKMMGVSYCIEH